MKPKPLRLEDLKPAPWNPREIDDASLGALKTSLGEFGDLSGITWNKRTGHLVAGHQRMRALRDAHGDRLKMADGSVQIPGGESFRVRVVDWPLEREKAANVAANSEFLAGRFTPDLTRILEEVRRDLPDLSESLRFKELLASAPEAKKEVVEDEVPEPPKKAVTRTGDLWLLGSHRLLCGDSTKAEDVGRVMDGATPFMMVTDPPYGVDYEGGASNAKKREKLAGDGDAALYDRMFALSPCAIAYAWFAGSRAGDVYFAAIGNGFKPRAMIVWNKLKPHYGAASADYKQRHEPCLYAVKTPPSRFIGLMSEPTVWDIEQARVNEHHPTQKPVECMARPMRNHKADEVYDPFLGSGTTLIAAEQLGRKCYGLELEPRYCDVIVKRWMALTKESPTLVRGGREIPWARVAAEFASEVGRGG